MKSGHFEIKRWFKLLVCALLLFVSAAAQADDLVWKRPEVARTAVRPSSYTAQADADDESAASDEQAEAGDESPPKKLSRAATEGSKPIARRTAKAPAAPAEEAFEDPFGDEAPAPEPQQKPKRANRRVAYQTAAPAPPAAPQQSHPSYAQPPYAQPPYAQPRYAQRPNAWNNRPYPGPAYQQPPYRPQYGPQTYPPQGNYLISQPAEGEAEVIDPGVPGAPMMEGPYEPQGLDNWPASIGCEDGSCGVDGGYGPYCPWPSIFYASTELGAQGFKSSVDRGQQGNFGIHEGFNLGAPFPLLDCHPLCHNIGMQFGMRFLQSNFQGDRATGGFIDEGRYQSFLTAGLFRRANEYSPWQFGIAYDWQHDQYYYEEDFSQIRFEISRFGWCGNEVGVTLAFGGEERVVNAAQQNFKLRPTDYYLLFLRRSLGCDGEWRVYAGPTGVGDGIFGGEFMLPVSDCLAIEGSATFMFPGEANSTGQREETSAIGLNFVWYPYRRGRCAVGSPFRPLLGVGDNGRFFVDRR